MSGSRELESERDPIAEKKALALQLTSSAHHRVLYESCFIFLQRVLQALDDLGSLEER